MSSPSSPSLSKGSSGFAAVSRYDQHHLTPRSKVKALLARIDDTSSSGQETSPRKLKKRKINLQVPGASLEQVGHLDTGGEDEEEESDEAPIIPRGRLAARLYRDRGRTPDSCASGEDNVYERIKHQLLPKPTPKHREPSSETQPAFTGNEVEQITTPEADPRLRAGDSSDQTMSKSMRRARSVTTVPDREPGITGDDDGSGSDLPAEPQNNAKLQALVARKKEELRAREESKRPKASKKKGASHTRSHTPPASTNPLLSVVSDDSPSEHAGDCKLTQQARPTRKASKKALQEMNRETQRMSRNMQLAHQAITRKKITKESFFSRFNFQCSKSETADAAPAQSSSTVASSAPPSDKENICKNESPPTSPLRDDVISPKLPATNLVQELPTNRENSGVEDRKAVLPDNLLLVNRLSQKSPSRKSPRRAEAAFLDSLNDTFTPARKTKVRKIKLPLTAPAAKSADGSMMRAIDSESDIEIVPPRNSKRSLKVFERLPAHGINEGRSLQTLRALAHLNSPATRLSSSKPAYTMSEMQISLQRQARKQAAEERAAKIQDLKDRGLIVQTAEERERDQALIEDLVEKARKEAAAIMQKEKDAEKKKKLASGEADVNDLTSDEDEDYEGDDADESDVDFSGSDDEEDSQHNKSDLDEDEDQSLDEDEEEESARSLACEPNLKLHLSPESNEAEERNDHTKDDENGELITMNPGYINERRRRRAARVVEDDDDTMDEIGKPSASSGQIAQKPFIPGLAFPNALAMGMTQAFAATMADLPSQGETAPENLEQDSLELLGPLPEPNFPMYDLEECQPMVLDSQPNAEHPVGDGEGSSMEITIDFSQPQIQDMAEDTQGLPTATQFSEIPDPTQDVGFEKLSPIRNRFVSIPPSTVDTVILSKTRNTPVMKRKGRLHRRTSLLGENAIPANAFDVLKKSAERPLKAVDPFDKKKSEARAMVEEQAQESEDEYAGLGGASDEETAGEEDEEIRNMVDEGEVEVDERKLAAFHANKERASDEKAVEKLFKALNNGGLRRKRGAEFDLSDSDDNGEARRRAKRREFAKMRKALLENENIGKIAEDPKKLAFLRAIEDRENDENYDLLEEPDSSPNNADTQDDDDHADAGPQSEPNPSAPIPARQRPLQDSMHDQVNRPAPAARRSRAFQKPSNLADIRASVSFLLEEPDTVPHPPITSSPVSSDTEDSHHPPTTSLAVPQTTVIDRLSLKRAESASTTTRTSSLSSYRPAFLNPATASSTSIASGFAVPSPLRRATTSNLLHKTGLSGIDPQGHSASVAVTERAAGGGEKGDSVRMGGTRKSSVGYFARDRTGGSGRKGVEVEREMKRRREGLKRLGRETVGLKALGTGTFD